MCHRPSLDHQDQLGFPLLQAGRGVSTIVISRMLEQHTIWPTIPLMQPESVHRASRHDIVARPRRLAPAPMVVTERDHQMLEALLTYRALSTDQIRRLFYPSRWMASSRLHRLALHKYVVPLARQRPYPGHKRGFAYRIGKRGAALLADDRGLAPSMLIYWGKEADRDGHTIECGTLYIEHMLELSELHIGLRQGSAGTNCRLTLWRDEADYRREHLIDTVRTEAGPGQPKRALKILPDGYAVLETAENQVGHFFVEIDRGTESIRGKWQNKVLGYKALFSSGLFHKRYDVAAEVGFRVLVTAPSAARALNIKAACERYGDPGLARLFLVAPLSVVEASNAVSDPIWLRGGTTVTQGLL